jgi:hypothetical protein
MLKSTIPNSDLIINTLIASEDHSSDRDFFNEKLLNFTVNNVVNNISDSEIYEYKPNLTNNINFNIFFLRYFQNSELDEIVGIMEPDFITHVNNTRNLFNLSGEQALSFNSVFEVKQSNSIRQIELVDELGRTKISNLPNSLKETKLVDELDRTKMSNLLSKPYFVRDIIGESVIKEPVFNGLPIFYNSFTIPFLENKDNWITDPLLYTNKPYFYNSFLLMEFYDSPFNLNQNRVQSIPIFVNSRYNLFEKSTNKLFFHERPCFRLTEGVEGFSFFFLNNYITNEFYVRFSFWDSLSGNQIPLIPSSTQEYGKKWIQDPNTFKQEARYLKYVLDYSNKTYKIFEYNYETNPTGNTANLYNLERTDFDLYELFFDTYFVGNRIPNQKPRNAKEQVVTTNVIQNPLKFDIKNLIFDFENTADFTKSAELSIPNIRTETYLGAMGDFINLFNYNITNSGLSSSSFTDFETKPFEIPTITNTISGSTKPTVINGTQILIKSFTATNIDDNIWRIRKISLEDINLKTSTKTFTGALYKESNSIISDKQKFKVAESIVLPVAPEILKNPILYFTKTLYDEMLDDIFPYLLKAIEQNRRDFFSQRTGSDPRNSLGAFGDRRFTRRRVDFYDNINTFDLIPAFLDKCIALLRVQYPFPRTNNHRYSNIISVNDRRVSGSRVLDRDNPNTNNLNTEIYYVIPDLIKAYNFAKENEPLRYNLIKNEVSGLMSAEFSRNKNFLNLNLNTFRFLLPDFYDLGYGSPELINLFLKLAKLQSVDNPGILGDNSRVSSSGIGVFRAISENTSPPLIFTPLITTPEAIRDYGFDIVLILNGDNFAQKGEQMKFDLFFNIGKYAKHQLLLDSNVNVTGKARVSLVNNNNDIKNIIIPIDFRIKP